nr:MAG TPA: hypothetical protein [Caudoviricetes sp.]
MAGYPFNKCHFFTLFRYKLSSLYSVRGGLSRR